MLWGHTNIFPTLSHTLSFCWTVLGGWPHAHFLFTPVLLQACCVPHSVNLFSRLISAGFFILKFFSGLISYCIYHFYLISLLATERWAGTGDEVGGGTLCKGAACLRNSPV
ncbi:hypothetical protein BS50DRAFT_405072 [Corynespora cassiicola Philippines]|uniref:Uncharacterized protein n=1 Tax=Corynespora cassiicola Philippines TaxID=1448308 RepID=A0A2T2NKY5_CORCC|nr:hypothetical protein BS50DRAFT_405072 [Corynespora cassiicola Philippines]